MWNDRDKAYLWQLCSLSVMWVAINTTQKHPQLWSPGRSQKWDAALLSRAEPSSYISMYLFNRGFDKKPKHTEEPVIQKSFFGNYYSSKKRKAITTYTLYHPMKPFFVFYWTASAGIQARSHVSSGLDIRGRELTIKNTDCFKHTPINSYQSPTMLLAYHGKWLK